MSRKHPERAQSAQVVTRLPLEAVTACERHAALQRRSLSGFIRGAVLDEITRLEARNSPAARDADPAPNPSQTYGVKL